MNGSKAVDSDMARHYGSRPFGGAPEFGAPVRSEDLEMR